MNTNIISMSIIKYLINALSSQRASGLILLFCTYIFAIISNSNYINLIKNEKVNIRVFKSLFHFITTVMSFIFSNLSIKYVINKFVFIKAEKITDAVINLVPLVILIPAVINTPTFIKHVGDLNKISSLIKKSNFLKNLISMYFKI